MRKTPAANGLVTRACALLCRAMLRAMLRALCVTCLAPAPALAQGVAPPTAPGAKAAVKRTMLRVVANAANANVTIDGIFVGQANALIDVEPGPQRIEVAAPGFTTRAIDVVAAKDRVTYVKVMLDKPRVRERAPLAARNGGKPRTRARRAAAGDELLGPNGAAAPSASLIDEFNSDANSRAAPAAPRQPMDAPQYAPPPANAAAPRTPPPDAAESGTSSTLVAVMPFGIGQFNNRSYGLGVSFAGAQLFALYHWRARNSEADAVVAETSTFVAAKHAEWDKRERDGRRIDDLEVAETTRYVETRQKYIDDTRRSAQLGLIGFGALWALSAFQAVNEEPVKAPKRKPRRRYSGFARATGDSGYQLGLRWDL